MENGLDLCSPPYHVVQDPDLDGCRHILNQFYTESTSTIWIVHNSPPYKISATVLGMIMDMKRSIQKSSIEGDRTAHKKNETSCNPPD